MGFPLTVQSNANSGALLISFSGIDGAGKSTQIEALEVRLRDMGMRAIRLAYWDDVAVLKRFREESMVKVFKGETGIGSSENPVRRNDKNVRRWYLTLGRTILFSLDAIHLRRIIRRTKILHPDVIIFDRYIYDPLAALPLERMLVRVCTKFLLAVAPRPDIAYVLDAEPEAAQRRKPEYPLDFLRRYRRAYLFLSALADLKVVEPASREEVQQRVWELMQMLLRNTAIVLPIPELVGREGAQSS